MIQSDSSIQMFVYSHGGNKAFLTRLPYALYVCEFYKCLMTNIQLEMSVHSQTWYNYPTLGNL